MGKQYREQIKKIRAARHYRMVALADDASIRNQRFKGAAKVLRKLDRLEKAIEHYHASEQRLFHDWFELTFHKNRQHVEERRLELFRLSDFHNSAIAASIMLDIELWDAIRLLRREEREYAVSGPEERARIDALRLERQQFVEAEMRREYAFDADDEMDEHEDVSRDLHEEDRIEIDSILQESAKEIQSHFDDFESGFSFLFQAFELSDRSGDPRVFLHVWDSAPPRFQSQFSKGFSKATGTNLESVIEDMRHFLKNGPAQPEDDYSDEFINVRNRSDAEIQKTALEEEAVKIIYRKLVRKVHPDVQHANGSSESWMNRMWHKIQDAYRVKNRIALDRLFKIVLLRSNDLSSLTITEIQQSTQWLQDDLRTLEREGRRLRKSPAWGFSKRTDHQPLIKKIAAEFNDQLSSIETEIAKLRNQHDFLERYNPGSQPRRPKKSSHRRKRGQNLNQEQMSFFD